MIRKLRDRMKSDRADSALVSLVILIPLLLALFITMIDTTIYQMNRSVLTNIARDGARTVAIYGGAGTATTATPLELAYGVSKNSVCTNSLTLNPVVQKAYKTAGANASSPVECQMLQTLANTPGLAAVEIRTAKCTPSYVQSIATEVNCTIEWVYSGIPGSAMTFLRDASSDEPGLNGISRVRGTANSEVAYDTNPLRTR